MKEDNLLNRELRKKREDLAGEYRLGDAGQIILFLIFTALWVYDSFFVHYSIIITNHIPLYVKLPLSIIVLAVSGYFAKAGLNIIFGEKRENPEVVKKGVFGVVRHPIYLGSILLYLGLLLFSFSVIAAVVWVVIIIFYYYISRHEEKLLIEKYGEEYKKYMNEVPMLIPLIRFKS